MEMEGDFSFTDTTPMNCTRLPRVNVSAIKIFIYITLFLTNVQFIGFVWIEYLKKWRSVYECVLCAYYLSDSCQWRENNTNFYLESRLLNFTQTNWSLSWLVIVLFNMIFNEFSIWGVHSRSRPSSFWTKMK